MTLPLPQRRRNSILLTALADVMFVLLFFFMLTAATVDRRGMALGVGARTVEPADEDKQAVLLLITRDQWRLGEIAVAPSELPRTLREGTRSGVRIVAAPGLPLQSLVDAIGVVRTAGLPLQLARGDGT